MVEWYWYFIIYFGMILIGTIIYSKIGIKINTDPVPHACTADEGMYIALYFWPLTLTGLILFAPFFIINGIGILLQKNKKVQ